MATMVQVPQVNLQVPGGANPPLPQGPPAPGGGPAPNPGGGAGGGGGAPGGGGGIKTPVVPKGTRRLDDRQTASRLHVH